MRGEGEGREAGENTQPSLFSLEKDPKLTQGWCWSWGKGCRGQQDCPKEREELALEPPWLCIMNKAQAGLISGGHWRPEAAPCFGVGWRRGSPGSWVLRFLRSWTQALTSAGCVSQSHSLPGRAVRRILGVILEKRKYLCHEALSPAKTGLCFYFASDNLSPL